MKELVFQSEFLNNCLEAKDHQRINHSLTPWSCPGTL